ncbi:hypothetical protein MCOR27_003345 [Pyricularia oryzae]|uniref:Triacylglycerol lipase n=2 Tax=Pyricularia TaxID=48558 RepID=Q0PND5_PYRGI|nr:triacylglycerol lipase [Pyricularia oryzae 70-15]ABG79932.1 triacylglycerol lipase [Pyricularia grisea]KAH8840607.1 hypothetical protein MCOR01_007308 [Pyricularia oryzae]EHA48636.1 triacylglycerol lipase [Pyricularia oryzae 70-15]KAH9434097.1 hypothetical protein MCOR02_006122 [Pyricularia oryzae]KAI6261622.1 hypothetical protein MCOR19_002072 [Pyricularia oryzae]
MVVGSALMLRPVPPLVASKPGSGFYWQRRLFNLAGSTNITVSACKPSAKRFISETPLRLESSGQDDPRLKEVLGRTIADDFAKLRSDYASPKYPVVLAHGLLGFSTLELAGHLLPPIEYWHGVRTALEARGVTVITPAVPPSASIAVRAAKLATQIADSVPSGTPVNIIAHSMGGLDARLLVSPAFADQLSSVTAERLNVASLVTISTPHRGSTYAEHVINLLGPQRVEGARRMLRTTMGWDNTEAFEQLTPRYMKEVFNPATPDHPDTRYFSYGAMTDGRPRLFSPFRASHKIIQAAEGPNDGLVSVESSKWGTYEGTVVGVSHLALINWTNRLGWTVRKWLGQEETFNAIAFYLDIADMLAKRGL